MTKIETDRQKRVNHYKMLIEYFLKLKKSNPKVRFLSALAISKDISTIERPVRTDKVTSYLEYMASMGLVVQSPHTLEFAFNEFFFSRLSKRDIEKILNKPVKQVGERRFEKWKQYVRQLRCFSSQ